MRLIRSIVTVGSFTMGSRILGLVRDVLIARYLGTGVVAEAFFVALRFPNLFRMLVAEGAFNATFVPLFARYCEEQGNATALHFARQVLAIMVWILLPLTLLFQLAMPWLMYAIAPGFAKDPVKFTLAVHLTQITLPYLLFMGLVALQSGILNSLHRYAAAAVVPLLFNVSLIISLWRFVPHSEIPGHILSLTVTVSGFLQTLVLMVILQRSGLDMSLPYPRWTPAIRRMFTLMAPAALSAGVLQVNLVVGTMLASFQEAAVPYLSYADRIYQLPLGVVGAAIGVVLLPELTRALRGGNAQNVHEAQNRCLEFGMFLTLPAAIALLIIPDALTITLFERGAFTRDASLATAKALSLFALGLPAYVAIKSFSPNFFAREDTRTPLRYSVAGVVTNITFSLALFPFFQFLAIPIATAVASWVQAALLGRRLWQLGHFEWDARLWRRLPRIFLASLLMGLALWLAHEPFRPFFTSSNERAILALGGLVLGGMVLYFALTFAFGVLPKGLLRRFTRPLS